MLFYLNAEGVEREKRPFLLSLIFYLLSVKVAHKNKRKEKR